MSEESKNDVVQTARKLLASMSEGARFKESDLPVLINRMRPALAALCNEVEQLRSLNQTQSESIETFQSQFRVMKEAIERTITFMRRWFGEHSSRKLPGDEELMALLESAITPKETEQKP